MAKDVVVEEGDGEDVVVEDRGEVISVDDLLAQDALDVVYIRLPEPWKGGIKARPLTNTELRQIVRDNTVIKRDRKGRALSSELDADGSDKDMIALSLMDPALTREQVDALFLKNSKLGRTILVALNKLNGFTPDEEAETVEQAEADFRA